MANLPWSSRGFLLPALCVGCVLAPDPLAVHQANTLSAPDSNQIPRLRLPRLL